MSKPYHSGTTRFGSKQPTEIVDSFTFGTTGQSGTQTIASTFGVVLGPNVATVPTAAGDNVPYKPYENVSAAAGTSPGWHKGYDVTAPRVGAQRRTAALSRCNAKLSDETHFADFFCTDVQITIGLGGSTGQGRLTRDFYPHNMIMPSYNITGICIDQEHYGALCEFVHQAQHKAIHDGVTTQFDLTGGLRLKGRTRGNHRPIKAQGYISAMPRTHQRWVYAPTFTFAFVVERQEKGIYHENAVVGNEQANWAALLSSVIANPTINPNADNGKSLSAAQQAAIQSYGTAVSGTVNGIGQLRF